MRRAYALTAAGLLLLPVLWLQGASRSAAALPAEKEACHGTAIEFLDTPKEAAKQALKEHKLVFVLHVSGNFEDPRFT
jgi:hypothetical protein